jgi:hypothetical protein
VCLGIKAGIRPSSIGFRIFLFVLIFIFVLIFVSIVIIIEHPVLWAFNVVELAALHGPEEQEPRSKADAKRDENQYDHA